MKKIILLVVIAAVITAGWLLYFRGDDGLKKVNVVYAGHKNLSNSLEFSGEVIPRKIYSVMSALGGRIDDLKVSEGSVVKKGDVLLELDTTQLEFELEKARLSYELLSDTQTQTVMAQSNAVSDKMAVEKARVALALSQTTGYDYESFNSAFGSEIAEQAAQYTSALEGMTFSDTLNLNEIGSADAETQLSVLEMNIKSIETTLEQMTIKSEIDGKVLQLVVNEGEVLSPGFPAMVIADTDNTLVSAYVYEKDVSDLEEDMKVKIIGDPGYYTGSISKIGASAAGIGDAGLFDTMTKVEIKPEDRFKRMPGAIVDIEIVVSEAKNVLCVPTECFTDDNCVFVVDEEGVLEKRTVVVGFRNMYYAQVVSGVSEDEMVVVSPKELTEGQKVEYDTGE